jgi:hypothetical protein
MSDYAEPKAKQLSVEDIADAKAKAFDTPVSQVARVSKKQKVHAKSPAASVAGVEDSALPARFGLLPHKEVSTKHAVMRMNFFQLEHEQALADGGDLPFGGLKSGGETAAAISTQKMMNNYASDIGHIQLANAHYSLLSPQAEAATKAAIKAVSIGQQLHISKPIGEMLDVKHSKAIGDALKATNPVEDSVNVAGAGDNVQDATGRQVLACYKKLAQLSSKVIAALREKRHSAQNSPEKIAIETQISQLQSAFDNLSAAASLVSSGLGLFDDLAAGPRTVNEAHDSIHNMSGTDIAGKASSAAGTIGRLAGGAAELYYAKDIQRFEAQNAALGAAINAYQLADLEQEAGEARLEIKLAMQHANHCTAAYNRAANSRASKFKRAGIAADKKMGDHQGSQALIWLESTLQAKVLFDIACATGDDATSQLKQSVAEVSMHRREKWNTIEDTWGIALGGMPQQSEESTGNCKDLHEMSVMARMAKLWTNAAHEAKRSIEQAISPVSADTSAVPQKGIQHVIGEALGTKNDEKIGF